MRIAGKTLLILSVSALLTACASHPLSRRNTPAQSSHQRPAPPPASVTSALMPRGEPEVPGNAPAQAARFNVAVDNVPARRFFLGLAQNSPYNIVVSDGVSGTITLHLKNVTFQQVMRTVNDVYGYSYDREGNTWVVLPNKLETRVFQVNYLALTRKATSKTRITSGQTTSPDTVGLYGGFGGAYGYGGGYGRGGENGRGRMTAGTRVETKSDSDFWKSITTSLKAIVGNKDGRGVIVNPASGVIVVRAYPKELNTVAKFLGKVQANIGREVIIEAKIIEVTLNSGFQSGINWAQLASVNGGTNNAILGQTAGQNLYDTGLSDLSGLPVQVNPLGSNPPSPFQNGIPTSAFGGIFTAAINLGHFSAFIELLKSQGTVHVLDSPRQATLNNQDAIIKVGSDEFFVTGVTNNTVTGTATTNASNIVLTPFFSGVALNVTPQINSDGEVTLYIHPTVSKVTDQTKTITVGGQQNTLPLAYSQVRESDSIVRAKSGQIVVIGGLMKSEVEKNHYSVPLLGDIPLLGNLFRQTRNQNVKTELVILLKPIVVGNGQTWSTYTREQQQALHQLGGG